MKSIILALLFAQVKGIGESCTHSIDRLKKGPADFPEVIKKGHSFEDDTFNGRQQIYWWGFTGSTKVENYENNLIFGNYAFQRLGDVYPDATLWGNNNPSWHDIMQGGAGTCYIEASMGAIAEFPDLVKNVFITQEKNDAGIYAFRFFIRGKPWIVTVDDQFLFKTNSNGEREPLFAYLGKNNQYWAMLLEKAWAKLKGTYESADGGFVENGLRSLIGCPVVSYRTLQSTADGAFALLKNANSLNYVMGAGTFGSSDAVLNQCGIAYAHAYSLISAFELMNADGVTVDHKLYMIRNPWGQSFYNQQWNSQDTTSWTSAYKAQVPHGVDPLTSQNDGIFFVSHTDFITCFDDYQIAHYRDGEGYTDNWYDKENDDGELGQYHFKIPAKDGDLYFTVEGYYQGSIPDSCWGGGYPTYTLTLFKNQQQLIQYTLWDAFHWPIQVLEADYSAGDEFILTVEYDWKYANINHPARDYTVKIYSKQDIEVKDADGKTNMWHMDGQFPSAFTKSHYRTETTTYTPEFKPRSLTDIWLVSNNVPQYFDMVQKNPSTLFKWYNN